jgi:hypothetical protein
MHKKLIYFPIIKTWLISDNHKISPDDRQDGSHFFKIITSRFTTEKELSTRKQIYYQDELTTKMEMMTTRIPLLFQDIYLLYSTLTSATERRSSESIMTTPSLDTLDVTRCSRSFLVLPFGIHCERTSPNTLMDVQYVKKTNWNEEDRLANCTPTWFPHTPGIPYQSILLDPSQNPKGMMRFSPLLTKERSTPFSFQQWLLFLPKGGPEPYGTMSFVTLGSLISSSRIEDPFLFQSSSRNSMISLGSKENPLQHITPKLMDRQNEWIKK